MAACAALGGCAVVSVAGAVAGAATSVTGAVVSTGVELTGKLIGAGTDAVAPDKKPEDDEKKSTLQARERCTREGMCVMRWPALRGRLSPPASASRR